MNKIEEHKKLYHCWLDYNSGNEIYDEWVYGESLYCEEYLLQDIIIQSAIEELKVFFKSFFNETLHVTQTLDLERSLSFKIVLEKEIEDEGYEIIEKNHILEIKASTGRGVLYGVFALIRHLKRQLPIKGICLKEKPKNQIRIINQWDNIDGSIERGYAGNSIFYENNHIVRDMTRIKDYARLLASVGINSIAINNVNVHYYETKFITIPYLRELKAIGDTFAAYGIKVFLSINFAAPIEIDGMKSADPLEEKVRKWWRDTVDVIYSYIPNLGGFLVKADSENRPGPFTYGRNHAEGANMLAEALEPYGGIVIWRCFVYNCHVDWRDRKTDRAKAAYDHFKPLDGEFKENVILQIKNGPMDFQIREPLSPLFGVLTKTNQMIEFQITQEYTGQQKHICYLVPMWKECLDFKTYAHGKESPIKEIISGKAFNNNWSGIAAVSNIGDSECWTGNPMAAVNLYGYGRLCWNPELTSEEIADEWIEMTLGLNKEVNSIVKEILLTSRKAYEDYTVPLGIGWMVNVGHHYGPNIEGYEYSPWGTYHYADYKGIGVDRSMKTGTGYTGQYLEPNRSLYENRETCPEELLLFFHHVPYTYTLKDGRTLIQYVYDVHFEGVEQVIHYTNKWKMLEGKIDRDFYHTVEEGLKVQLKDAIEWRDVVNTYFYRKVGIKDNKNRKIYE